MKNHQAQFNAVKKLLKKIFPLRLIRNNNSGIILLTVMWVLIILSVLAISTGRSTNIELTLAKHAIGKAQTKYFAWAGVAYSINQIRLDSEDDDSKKMDTLYQCAVLLEEGESLEENFGQKFLDVGSFEVGYFQPFEGSIVTTEIGEVSDKNERIVNEFIITDEEVNSGVVFHGLEDEERRININAINGKNKGVLSSLIALLGTDEQTSIIIASSILDWKDKDDVISGEQQGAENEYYQSLSKPYQCKNAPFESVEELLLVKGMTKDIFRSIKPYVTVFGKKEKLTINFDTASKIVLKAVARYGSGFSPTVEFSDADTFVEKILEFRNGDDGIENTRDDVPIDHSVIGLLLAPEKILYLVTNQFRTKVSNFIRINVVGRHNTLNARSNISAVVNRKDLSIVDWKRK